MSPRPSLTELLPIVALLRGVQSSSRNTHEMGGRKTAIMAVPFSLAFYSIPYMSQIFSGN
jgi:hypothetical protein